MDPTSTILLTTPSFASNDTSAHAVLSRAGFHVEKNPHGRTLAESEVIELLQAHRLVAIIAGVEPLTERVFQSAAAHLKAYESLGHPEADFPVAARQSREILSIFPR